MPIKKTHIRNLLLLILTVGMPLMLAVIFAKDLRALEAVVRAAGLWGPIISVSLFVLFGFTPLPAEPLALMNGVVFGPFLGSLLNLIGNTAACMVFFYGGGRMSAAADFESPLKKLPASLQQFSPDSLWFLIGVRLIPQIGGKVVSFAAGIYHVPIGKYLWTSIVTNLLGSLLFSFIGFGLIHL